MKDKFQRNQFKVVSRLTSSPQAVLLSITFISVFPSYLQWKRVFEGICYLFLYIHIHNTHSRYTKKYRYKYRNTDTLMDEVINLGIKYPFAEVINLGIIHLRDIKFRDNICFDWRHNFRFRRQRQTKLRTISRVVYT